MILSRFVPVERKKKRENCFLEQGPKIWVKFLPIVQIGELRGVKKLGFGMTFMAPAGDLPLLTGVKRDN